MPRRTILSVVVCCLVLGFVSLATAQEPTEPAKIEPQVSTRITPVVVTNFPATQNVDGTVNVANLPAVQQVGGAVNVGNLPLDMAGNLRTSPPGVLSKLLVLAVNVDIPGDWISEPFDVSAYTKVGLLMDVAWGPQGSQQCEVQWGWSDEVGFVREPGFVVVATRNPTFSQVFGLRGQVHCYNTDHLNRIEVLLRRE
ncbi:MAG: hypothetical protein LAO51_08675 [Acidobacteriia bacterium]|nr:hypothetical protein [Terriglobia bacterium]